MKNEHKEMSDNTSNIAALMEEVNPVYMTAQRCLQIIAGLGDEDSKQLCGALGLPALEKSIKDLSTIPEHIVKALNVAKPVFQAIPEVRFLASTNLIMKSGAKQVVDLPCGYTARGIKMAKSGVRYFGFDLPAVTQALGNAVRQLIGDNKDVKYCAVDATSYSSLRDALEGAEGELLITTEGMLMYFTQSELETVFANIRKLLSEFGGKWVTVDVELDYVQKQLMNIITDELEADWAEQVKSIVASYAAKLSKTTLLNNILYDSNQEKVKQFVSDMRFNLEVLPMRDYLPESLGSFSDLSPDVRKKAFELLGAVNFWVMTVKPKIHEDFEPDENNFEADVKMTGDTLNIALSGRLDTITSTELLSQYKEASAKGKVSAINIDMKNLEYISSAGLRVLLIMRKAVGDSNRFNILNMSEFVKSIMTSTGFDTIMC